MHVIKIKRCISIHCSNSLRVTSYFAVYPARDSLYCGIVRHGQYRLSSSLGVRLEAVQRPKLPIFIILSCALAHYCGDNTFITI